MSKRREKLHAEYFVRWLKKAKGLDYECKLNPEESSDVDSFAHSPSGKHIIKMQHVFSGGEISRQAVENTRRWERGQRTTVADVDLIGWVGSVVEKKVKKYPVTQKRELILIIEGFSPTPIPAEVEERFSHYRGSDFKGVYYVSLPVSTYPQKDYLTDGYVVVLKDAFK